ncbi:MAG TPA: aspartate aminotransferase family protein [Terriglobales bacterium]|nr:aspartate aminotransferase family protein [Terriglobales bacterium]
MPIEVVSASALYSDHVNPQWVKLLDLLGMNVRYTRCSGAELFTEDGNCVLDFLSGYCVHNVGHNHPSVVAALKEELDRFGPAMLQSHVPEAAGDLAAKLCKLTGGRLSKVFFASSGSEGVESAIKFARAHTGRTGLLYTGGAFHGLTCGALSLMGNSFWREGFGPMLPGAEQIPFENAESLDAKLKTRQFAAFIVEPVQAEGGIRIPQREYLQAAQELCRKYGTLFVLDEVQTGMFRTGAFLAAHHYDLDPDIVVLAKALSGGLIPIGAVLMSDEVYKSVYSSLKRAIVHTSTYSENALAMRAGLATLEVLETECLGRRAILMGDELRRQLRETLSGYEMVKEIRGIGLLSGIEFQPPSKISLRVPFEAFQRIHPGLFGQMVVMRMFRDERILTQICGNNFMVLKAAPPLVVEETQIDQFVGAMGRVVELIHSSSTFWADALDLARRALNI